MDRFFYLVLCIFVFSATAVFARPHGRPAKPVTVEVREGKSARAIAEAQSKAKGLGYIINEFDADEGVLKAERKGSSGTKQINFYMVVEFDEEANPPVIVIQAYDRSKIKNKYRLSIDVEWLAKAMTVCCGVEEWQEN